MSSFRNVTYVIPLIQALPFIWAKIFVSSFTAFKYMINPKLSLVFADTKAFLNKKNWQELIKLKTTLLLIYMSVSLML